MERLVGGGLQTCCPGKGALLPLLSPLTLPFPRLCLPILTLSPSSHSLSGTFAFPSVGLLAQGDSSFNFGWSKEPDAKSNTVIGISGCFSRESSEELPCCHFRGLGVFSVALGIIQPVSAESFRKPFCMHLALLPTCSHISVSQGFKTMGKQRQGARRGLPLTPPHSPKEFLTDTENERIPTSALDWVRKHGAM